MVRNSGRRIIKGAVTVSIAGSIPYHSCVLITRDRPVAGKVSNRPPVVQTGILLHAGIRPYGDDPCPRYIVGGFLVASNDCIPLVGADILDPVFPLDTTSIVNGGLLILKAGVISKTRIRANSGTRIVTASIFPNTGMITDRYLFSGPASIHLQA